MAVYEDSEFSSPHHTAPLANLFERFSGLVDHGKFAVRRYVVRTQTERALSKLSDRLLTDIGITRSEIAAFSANAAQRASH